ncbi:hypothetical protein CIPAW_05G235100 [Carya illinoinensis]|uniref:non-specific serine/threonine protein kinase n=1 Tax=Carya illinoinensis TaxID=32201 RepID=A0A8T1QLP8_CARIL|nr:hypothetical protein CIPAW_05G235100 [Carya illinoinensis]
MARATSSLPTGVMVLNIALLLLIPHQAVSFEVTFTYEYCGPSSIAPSSCANHDIRYPFRLEGKSTNCSDPRYELSCESNHSLLYNDFGGKYYVQQINYDKKTIRLVDSGIQEDNFSFIPRIFINQYIIRNGSSQPMDPRYRTTDGSKGVVIVNCEKPIMNNRSSYLHLETSTCSNYPLSSRYSQRYLYLLVLLDGKLPVMDVEDSCKIEQMSLTSRSGDFYPNISRTDLHNVFLSGFELRWIIRSDGFGTIFKGTTRSGSHVAVKMLGKSKANGQEFTNEMATIGRIHHVNVVQLIGFCVHGSKRALVYDFMPHGSLNKYIFSSEGSISLSCEKTYNIALGVACGIQHLHRGCDMQILHFDIKPHNILLDENFIPKVSDFGLAKLYPLYYRNIGGISYKADVYSFGMLLMEMVGKRKNLNAFTEHSSQIYFPTWVKKEIVKKMIIVALWCIQMNPSNRPTMNKVVEMLEGKVEQLQIPPKAPLSSQREW